MDCSLRAPRARPGPCGARPARGVAPPRPVRARAASPDAGQPAWDEAGSMGVLMARVAALRQREERAAAGARLLDALRAARPILPDNVSPAEDVLDHALICEWHETSWERLAAVDSGSESE
jgi:hypothetical protein